ncbi:hypothetical protein ENUP19_0341G0033 [Entamoeba nuttalli]|uniref:Uncharacterized protein n=1 Tax=Entamoeba nuttalli TaxID=412467 RepID=A0ABQ0DXC2_9EUKA
MEASDQIDLDLLHQYVALRRSLICGFCTDTESNLASQDSDTFYDSLLSKLQSAKITRQDLLNQISLTEQDHAKEMSLYSSLFNYYNNYLSWIYRQN